MKARRSWLSGNAEELRFTMLKEAPVDPQALIRLARDSRGTVRLAAGETPVLLRRLKPGEAPTADMLLQLADGFLQQLLTAEAGKNQEKIPKSSC